MTICVLHAVRKPRSPPSPFWSKFFIKPGSFLSQLTGTPLDGAHPMRAPISLLTVLAVLFTAISMPASAAVALPAPAVVAVRGKVVHVKVPPGFTSVTLHQRTGLKTRPSKTLGVKVADPAGGTVGFVVRTTFARRALYATGVPVATPTTAVGMSVYPADPSPYNGIEWFYGGGGGFPITLLDGGYGLTLGTNIATLGTSVVPTPAREVAESDIWRVAGDRLYFFNQLRGLQVFDVSNPDDPALLGQLREPGRGEEMYLLGTDHVALLTRPEYSFSIYGTHTLSLTLGSPLTVGDSGELLIVDVKTGLPVEVARLSYPGRLRESRLVGTALYIVSSVFDFGVWPEKLHVTSFDLSDPAHPAQTDTLALGAYGGVVAATDRFLFAVRHASDFRHSTIDVIDISAPDGALKRVGQIEAAGFVGDKFKMNLEGDILTVVSQVPRNWYGTQADPATALHTVVETFSLAQPAAPLRLGSLTIGVGEILRATRFADGRVYVVTFLNIDPLWVIDLADPANPTLLGELEVPGFSTYIEPLGDRLVAFGRVAGRIAVSLFDVADPAHPILLSQIPLGSGYSYSEAERSEKAFNVIPEENLILVPYSAQTNRLQLIDLTRDALTLRGVVDRPVATRRTEVVNGRILALSSGELVSVDFADRDHPLVTSQVEIAWKTEQVFLSGTHLVQVGGAVGWSSTTAPTITVSTASDPDTALSVIELDKVPVVGATVRDGRLYVAQHGAASFHTPGITLDQVELGSPLIVSVFDLSQLPSLTLLGRTQTRLAPSFAYGTWEAAWPDAGTLVWVRPQETNWVSVTPKPHFTPIAVGSVSSVTLSGSSSTGTLVVGSGLIGGPWSYGNSGHEMLVFDVRTPSAPAFATALNLGVGRTREWSAPLAVGGRIYISYLADGDSAAEADGSLPRTSRSFMRRVDFTADARNPTVGPDINIPGKLLAVVRGGATLLTVGCGYDPARLATPMRTFHTSSFDGVSARLVDQVEKQNDYEPHTMDGATLLLGRIVHNPTLTGLLQTWRVGEDEKLTLTAQLATPWLQSLATVHGLCVGFSGSEARLYDVSDPSHPAAIPGIDTRELNRGNLGGADGGPGLGIWVPQGDYGVGVVALPK